MVKRAAGVVVLVLLLVLAPAARSDASTTYTWTGQGFDHLFGTQENWSPVGVPDDGDSIVVARLPGGPAQVQSTPSLTLQSITLGEGGRIYGPGLLTTSSFDWTGGTLGIDLTVTGAMTVSGTDFKEANKTVLHQGRVAITLTGTSTSTFGGTGELRLSFASLRNEGTLNLGSVLLGGGGCCTNPNPLVNAGTITAGTAVLRFLRYDQTTTGRFTSGSIILDRGDHILRGGTIGSGARLISASSLVTFTGGTVGLDGTLTVQGSSDVRGQATLAGAGLLRFVQGTIFASLTVDAGFEASGSGGKDMNGTPGRGGGNLTLKGTSTIAMPAGSTLGLSSAGTPLTLRNEGVMTLRSGAIVGTSCCSSPSTFNNVGVLIADAGAGRTVGLQNLAVRSSGLVSVRTGTLAFAGVAPVVSGGSFSLAGGKVSVPSSTPLTLNGGRLTGSGTVQGPVKNAGGIVSPGGTSIGTLTVGAYQQASAGRLEVQVRSSTSADRLAATGAAKLAGALAISRLGTTTISPGTIKLLTTTARTGTFSPVTGLAQLGSGWRLVYNAAAVRLVKP
jgi:hypothetical protein